MLDVFVMSVLVALVKLGEMTPCCLAAASSPSGVFSMRGYRPALGERS
jgi:uncharacterized paraquat-inducible protein A